MNLNEFIRKQQISKNTEKIKLHLLKSVSELLLIPKPEYLKPVIKYLSILANSYHVNIESSIKAQKFNDIDKMVLNKTSELIKNENGYKELLPEMFKVIVSFAKIKSIQLAL